MRTAKSAILLNAIVAGLFLLLALAVYVAFYHVFPTSQVNEQSLHIKDAIQNIKDIEQLKRIALSENLNVHKSINSLISSADLIITISIFAGGIFLLNILFWVKFLRENNNRPVARWLRWL